MKLTENGKRILSALLLLVLVFTMLPFDSRAAEASRKNDTIFFATDRHESTSNLNSLLKAMAYEPGLVVLGGDHVNNTNRGSLATITSEIQAVYAGVQTFYTYAAHDSNVSEDSSNPYAYARTGEYYTGEDYYVYAVDQNDMQSSSSASSASAKFVSWADNVDASKVIFVMCHMPIHKRRNDNAGGAVWMDALNQVGQTHDVVFLWGHNHTGESSADTSVYFVGRGGSLTPQGGSTGTIYFTYMNAGYIKNGYATMAVINDDNVTFTRYSKSGSVTSVNTMERLFAAHSHSWSVVSTVDATCGAEGSRTYACSCGETYTETIPATDDHAYSSIRADATCTEAGSVTYTCGNCGDSYTEVISAAGHSYESTVTDATCTTDGYTTYICTVCDYSYKDEEVTALGHDYESKVTATCTEDGFVVYTCKTCGHSYDGEAVEAYGHSYESTTVAPACATAGYTTYVCTACGHTYTGDEVAALGHAYASETVEATCTENGYTTYTCTTCGDSYIADEIAALGHDYAAAVTEPTCTEGGYTTYTCALCGDSYVGNQTEALGHSYTAEEVDGYMVYTCTTCGDSYSEKIQTVSYTKVSSISNNNRYVITLYSGSKYYALSHENNKISAVQVTVSNGVITSEITEDLIWDYSGKKLSYVDGDTTYYLYAQSTGGWWGWLSTPTLTLSTSSYSSVSFSSSKLKVGSYYLRYSNSTVSLNRSATTTYCFVEE